ncbi:oligosaccharide flippase family protein, partial [Enterobacter hormaechei]|nr:oligosaccharide flippase family protein [Enterobacter hormaechei]
MNKSIFVTFAGGLLSAILTFMVNVVAAKYLVVAEFNQLAVFINATVILSAIFEFGLSSSLIVIYKKKDKHHCEMLASMAIVGMIGIFILLLPVVYYYWGINSVLCVFASLLMTVHKVLNIFNQID